MTWQPNMNHFVKHWLSDPAPPRHVPWFERDVRRPPPGWVIHLQNIPTADPTVAGPQDMGRGRGHHDLNLEQQLEARARVTLDTLTWLEWISLSPYVRPTDDGGFTWNHNDREGVNDGQYEAWLDVWFGHHGAEEAIQLRRWVMDAIESTLDLQRVPWSSMSSTQISNEKVVQPQSNVAEAWKASGELMRGLSRLWKDASGWMPSTASESSDPQVWPGAGAESVSRRWTRIRRSRAFGRDGSHPVRAASRPTRSRFRCACNLHACLRKRSRIVLRGFDTQQRPGEGTTHGERPQERGNPTP